MEADDSDAAERRGRRWRPRAAAAVGPVEPGPLENDAHRGEDLAQLAATVLVHGQRIIGEPLDSLELATALGANVLVSGHDFLPANLKSVG